MRSKAVLGLVGWVVLAGCASTNGERARVASTDRGAGAQAAASPPSASPAESASAEAAALTSTEPAVPAQGPWIHAEPNSDVVLSRGGDGFLGVWVDVPESSVPHVRAPVDLALVIDVSGSMEGAKIEAARASARTLVGRLADGDILSVDVFSDAATALVPPVRLTPATRARVLSRIAELGTGGSTNLFDGLQLAETHVAQAPADHPVRRIVLISDGQANVGPSSPEALAEVAARSLPLGAQVTSLGVGLDYDEHTLDAIAESTSGRLFHVGDPREMQAILEHEVTLLASTVADQAFIEVVPAPGVELAAVDGAHVDWAPGRVAHIPLGSLYAGQHREALVRVRVNAGATGTQRALASVRLVFRDPAENDVERLQEVLAKVTASDDPAQVAAHENAATRVMMATLAAAQAELRAAQAVGAGDFASAQAQLADTDKSLQAAAAKPMSAPARKQLDDALQTIAAARMHASAAAGAGAAAPPAPATVREDALEMNRDAMRALGH